MQSPGAELLCNVGCCYNHLTTGGFPLSQHLRASGYQVCQVSSLMVNTNVQQTCQQCQCCKRKTLAIGIIYIQFMDQGHTYKICAVCFLQTLSSHISDGQKCENVRGAATGQTGPGCQDAQHLPALESGARGDHSYYRCVSVSESAILPHYFLVISMRILHFSYQKHCLDV